MDPDPIQTSVHQGVLTVSAHFATFCKFQLLKDDRETQKGSVMEKVI